jgi:hypothetical protein
MCLWRRLKLTHQWCIDRLSTLALMPQPPNLLFIAANSLCAAATTLYTHNAARPHAPIGCVCCSDSCANSCQQLYIRASIWCVLCWSAIGAYGDESACRKIVKLDASIPCMRMNVSLFDCARGSVLFRLIMKYGFWSWRWIYYIKLAIWVVFKCLWNTFFDMFIQKHYLFDSYFCFNQSFVVFSI